MRALLKLAAYRRLLAAYTLNELAWAIGSLALALLVYRRTGSAVGAMGYFLCSQFVPALIAPGIVARVDQRRVGLVLPVLYGLEAAAFLLLAWSASQFVLVAILILTVLDGVFALTARPLARATAVAVTAPRGLLREGNALTNTAFSVCYMAGPAAGAGVVLAGGTTAALLVNSGLFVAIAFAIATARGLPTPPPRRSPVAGRLHAALVKARADRGIRTILALQVTAILIFTIAVPVEVVFAQHSLHTGAGGYGALLTAWGAGAVLGAAAYARWRSMSSRALVTAGAALLGAGMSLMAAAPTLAVAVIGSAIGGIGNGIEAVAVRTALQEQVEQHWMAMVMSLSESLTQAVPGGGILLGGAIAALAGPRAALAVAGGGALLVAVAASVVLRADTTVQPAIERDGAPANRAAAPALRR